jgi:hypothetical protein
VNAVPTFARPRLATPPALFTACLALGACGEEDDGPVEPPVDPAEERAVTGVTRDYILNADPRRCQELATAFGENGCRRYARGNRLRDVELRVEEIDLARTDATVSFTVPGRGPGSLLLRKVEGRWRGEAVVGRDYVPK